MNSPRHIPLRMKALQSFIKYKEEQKEDESLDDGTYYFIEGHKAAVRQTIAFLRQKQAQNNTSVQITEILNFLIN